MSDRARGVAAKVAELDEAATRFWSLAAAAKEVLAGMECPGATHSPAVNHCAECCFGTLYTVTCEEDARLVAACKEIVALAAVCERSDPK